MSEQIKDGGPAFGQVVELRCVRVDPTGAEEWEPEICCHGGLTVRDYFAAKSIPMAAALEREYPTGGPNGGMYVGIAIRAYLLADAMLSTREAKS